MIPSNDFSLYDRMLDIACLVGAVPERFHWTGDHVDLDTLFRMARGIKEEETAEGGVPAMEMTKWFDTNHYRVEKSCRLIHCIR